MDTVNNQQLLAAVERMNRENSRESREAVLDLVISSAAFLAPVTIQAPAPKSASKETQIQFKLLANQEDQVFSPPSPTGRSCASCAAPRISRRWCCPLMTTPA